jgi:Sec-independent protein translocase protein TatA
MRFFNLGASELMLILVFAILAIGPKETLKLFNRGREIVASIQSVLSDLTSEVGNLAKDVVDTSEDNNSTKQNSG